MNKLTKIAAGSLAALTLTVGVLAASSTEAQAWGRRGWGPAIGLGIAAGIIGTAAYAATAPGYYGDGCRYVERYDRWGNYRGTRRVCDSSVTEELPGARDSARSARPPPFHPRADCLGPLGQSPSGRVVPFWFVRKMPIWLREPTPSFQIGNH